MTPSPERPLHIVAVGAHLDDCYLGAAGTLLKAARAGHRITLVTAVTTYGAWPVVTGRQDEIKPLLQGLADRIGAAQVSLGHDYERLENGVALITQLAQTLAELKPDIVFCHYEFDTNQDHVVLGLTTPVAAMHNACFADGWDGPRELYKYKTDSQTLDFVPNTYVNITNEIWDVVEMIGAVDDMYAQRMGSLDRLALSGPDLGDRTVKLTHHGLDKFANCAIWGTHCGARYAEGFRAYPYRRAGATLLDQL